MQTGKASLKVILAIVLASFICSGCSIREFSDNMMVDQGTLNRVADPQSEMDYRDEAKREMDVYGDLADDAKVYYDEKTGDAVSEVQYYAYNITDGFKYYGIYVTIFLAAVGFLLRRFVRNSASIRKLGLMLEIGIPVIYVVLAYVLSAIADRM